MKYFWILLMGFTGAYTWAQEGTRTEETWFDDLVTAYYDGEYWTALMGFERFMETYPGSEFRPRAEFNRACLLRELGKPDQAIAAFKAIMRSDFDEYEPYGGIMEQYALYKNRSAGHLAELYLELEDYDQAAAYVYQYDKVYPYQHFCGNELSANEIFTATLYARVYYGQGKPRKAIEKLLPHVFYNGLAGNAQVLELLEIYLPQTYSRDEMVAALEQAISDFRPQGKASGTLKLLGVKIPVYEYAFYDWHNPLEEEVEGLSWKGKLPTLLKNHPVFGRYLSL
ncbi:tetratricopeptide repeat protein [Robiginitalea sediminis]|uniref:tetratricopeptide repeat protein n=1 Tax=Robiginitalea sediminis TaxID=1982593 RepID=UPI000B4BD743|nr:tetratricopeptide repeat protein [Robiginitalea sediminis]